jgi:hypothetical protein
MTEIRIVTDLSVKLVCQWLELMMLFYGSSNQSLIFLSSRYRVSMGNVLFLRLAWTYSIDSTRCMIIF